MCGEEVGQFVGSAGLEASAGRGKQGFGRMNRAEEFSGDIHWYLY
jgi:hypothetical protein